MQTEHFRMLLLLVVTFASLSHGYGASMEQKELVGMYCSTQSIMNRWNKNCVISIPSSFWYVLFQSTDHTLPMFKMDMCPNDADICIQVNFPNGNTDRLILTRVPDTSSVYEGFLELEPDVPAVMVNLPRSNRQMVILSC